jgi:hypothetical protein
MRCVWLLLGEAGAGARAWKNPELIWSTVALAVLLLLGAVLIHLARRWRARLAREKTRDEQLAEYDTLHARGEISQEELERIRRMLASPAPHERARDRLSAPPDERITRHSGHAAPPGPRASAEASEGRPEADRH